jgi:hypothetical protein
MKGNTDTIKVEININATYMKHFVRAGFNAWYHMGWTETNLLHFSEIV